MDYGHGKMRMNVEGDRLRSLPDDLIHKILSFRPIKDAIGTSVLSSRWRFVWTTMPYLNFSSRDFSTLPDFSKFVTHVLSCRNDMTEVHSLKLGFRGKASQGFVKRILNYAFSRNIQELNVVFLQENDIEFPISLLVSRSLKNLSFTVTSQRYNRKHVDGYFVTLTSTWELPVLTTLDLHSVTFCDGKDEKCIGIFSKCPNLKNLTLKRFKTKGSNGFSIFHSRLSNLTLERSFYVKVVKVVAPQLQNLTIKSCYGEHVISAPHLASLLYKGYYPLHLSTDGFLSLKKANICVSHPHKANANQIVRLLQHVNNVKFLTLSLEIVETLSSSVDLILHQPSLFVNLESLEIYPEQEVYVWNLPSKKVPISTELKSYLLDGSPGVTFKMVLREEIGAHKLMAELGVLLEKHKENTKTNSESHKSKTNKKLKFGDRMTQIKGHWENLGVQIEQRKNMACLIISKLESIEELLTTLPASNGAKIQPSYSRLCAEANIAISNITNCIKIQCDENQSRLNVYCHELAKILEPSS